MDSPAGAAALPRRLASIPDLAALAGRHPARYPLLLESAAHGTARARYDLLLALPGEGIVLDRRGLHTLDGQPLAGGFLDALDAAHAGSRTAVDCDSALPFCDGWALLLGYELAAEIEPTLRLPPAPPGPPTALALRCHGAVIVDHAERCAWLVAETEQHLEVLAADVVIGDAAQERTLTPGPSPGGRGEQATPSGLAEAGQGGRDAGRSQTGMFAREGYRDVLVPGPASRPACPAPHAGPALPAFSIIEEDPQRFLAGVLRIKEYLAAGDVFQVNLSRAWHAHPERGVQPIALYHSLRHANPAPFAGLFQHADWAVASSSPERLVTLLPGAGAGAGAGAGNGERGTGNGGVGQGRGAARCRGVGTRIETRPIAGTRSRSGDAGSDAAAIAELLASPKERAEHVMLIDLERNDLGRVCVPGSVQVEELMAVESYRHVHHIESTVAGILREGVGPGAAIRAVFPGGTITGCPKVRCMQIIAELEDEGRGAYTGAMGYLSRDGRMDLNILIRTLSWDGSRVRLRAGAGIVADSDPQAELAETRAKARGLLNALQAGPGTAAPAPAAKGDRP